MDLEYKDVPIKVFNRCAKCILCGGEYRSTGAVYMSNPPQYHHRCDKCGHSIALDECYPKIVFVEEQSREVVQE